MSATKDSEFKYLDFQASVGITKHNGGFAATDELLALCHIERAKDVLEVGCGIGVGPAYVARKYGCHVVGVDISEKMVAWSRLRAREERVEDKVEFQVADVLQLPFEADRFDVVLCQSVLAFVEDKRRALAECVRVTKPGGYVGLNETFWKQEPSAEVVAWVRTQVGSQVPAVATWQALWEESGLAERVVRLHDIDPRGEIRDRMQWVGRRWAIRGFARLARLYLTNPALRKVVKDTFRWPSDAVGLMGHGLFVGRKYGWACASPGKVARGRPSCQLRDAGWGPRPGRPHLRPMGCAKHGSAGGVRRDIIRHNLTGHIHTAAVGFFQRAQGQAALSGRAVPNLTGMCAGCPCGTEDSAG